MHVCNARVLRSSSGVKAFFLFSEMGMVDFIVVGGFFECNDITTFSPNGHDIRILVVAETLVVCKDDGDFLATKNAVEA